MKLALGAVLVGFWTTGTAVWGAPDAAGAREASRGPSDASVRGAAGQPDGGAGYSSGARVSSEEAAPRDTFVVQPFTNVRGARTLSYLETGLPAFIAERLSQHGSLRFVGGVALLPRGVVAAKWTVTGAVDRLPDWHLQIRVRVTSTVEGGPTAEAVREGPKEQAERVGLEATLAAFAALPDMKLLPASAAMLAKFGRDPYSFVLYGRGIANYLGLAGQSRSADNAEKLLKRSLVIDPKVPEARRYLGLVHFEANRPGHARAMLSYALDLRPDYVSALGMLAALDRAAGSPAARERYARLVELDPDDGEGRRNLGELLSEAGQLDKAQIELERVVAGAPADLRARRSLALVLAARRAGAELVAELEEIVKLDSENVDARMDLAAAYAGVKKNAEAEAVYDDVLRRKPRLVPALKLAGDLASERGDVKKAAALYGKLRAVAPQDPRPVFLLGAAQYAAGNLDAAERLFSEGLRYPGMMGDAYSNLGAIALRRGKSKEALSLLSRATKRRPEKANVRFNYAMALYTANRHADALNELRTAAVLDPADAGVRFFSGVIELRLGLLKQAEESFREALRLDPGHEDARHNLSLLEPLVRQRREGSLSFGEGSMPLEVVPVETASPTPKRMGGPSPHPSRRPSDTFRR